MIRNVHPGSGMFIPDPDLDFFPIPDPGSRCQKGTGSRIRIRTRKTEGRVPLPEMGIIASPESLMLNPRASFSCDTMAKESYGVQAVSEPA
jgi:hypothetical protein